jgi:hypothetical protein
MEQSKENLTKAERKALKAKNKARKEQSKFLKNNNGEKTNILCVRFGNKYGKEYVEKLRNMVAKHTTLPYEFVCLTDDQHPIEGVRSIVRPNHSYAKGWWHKVHMFDPTLPLQGRILYMDLDVVIHDNIDKLLSYQTNQFVGILDFNRKFHQSWKYLNSSVLSWNAGTQTHIWDQFIQDPGGAMRLQGDQDWIWKTSNHIIKFWPIEWIQSYKWEIRSREELHMKNGVRQFREVRNDVVPPLECCVAVFHGNPNPAEVQDKFVVDNWR